MNAAVTMNAVTVNVTMNVALETPPKKPRISKVIGKVIAGDSGSDEGNGQCDAEEEVDAGDEVGGLTPPQRGGANITRMPIQERADKLPICFPYARADGAAPDINLERNIQESPECEAALASGDTFSKKEWMLLLRHLMSCNQQVADTTSAQVQVIVMERDTETLNNGPHQSAAAAVVPTVEKENSREMKAKAFKKAEKKLPQALAMIQAAEQAFGEDEPVLRECLREAHTLLKNTHRALPGSARDPKLLARGSADTQCLIHDVQWTCKASVGKSVVDALMKANKEVRNLVVLECQEDHNDPKDRDEFLTLLGAAFAGGLGLQNDRRAQLLKAYQDDPDNCLYGFTSNNGVASIRRGGPRPRHRTAKPAAVDEGAEESEEDDEESNPGGVYALPLPANHEESYMPYDPYRHFASEYWPDANWMVTMSPRTHNRL